MRITSIPYTQISNLDLTKGDLIIIFTGMPNIGTSFGNAFHEPAGGISGYKINKSLAGSHSYT